MNSVIRRYRIQDINFSIYKSIIWDTKESCMAFELRWNGVLLDDNNLECRGPLTKQMGMSVYEDLIDSVYDFLSIFPSQDSEFIKGEEIEVVHMKEGGIASIKSLSTGKIWHPKKNKTLGS